MQSKFTRQVRLKTNKENELRVIPNDVNGSFVAIGRAVGRSDNP